MKHDQRSSLTGTCERLKSDPLFFSHFTSPQYQVHDEKKKSYMHACPIQLKTFFSLATSSKKKNKLYVKEIQNAWRLISLFEKKE